MAITNLIKILWIDNNLDQDLARYRMALLMQDDMEVHFARNASEAHDHLSKFEEVYDVVIFDIRLPAGPNDMWDELQNNGEQKFGLVLLIKILSGLNNAYSHLKSTKFGVYTIESIDDTPELVGRIPEDCFRMKTDTSDERDFINFIHQVYNS